MGNNDRTYLFIYNMINFYTILQQTHEHALNWLKYNLLLQLQNIEKQKRNDYFLKSTIFERHELLWFNNNKTTRELVFW